MAKRQIHWAVPTTCLAGLLAGILFALGHHLFYWNLDGQSAADGQFTVLGSQVPRQQINIAGGTAFAFLVNFCLGTAMTTAFFQVFWRDMLRRQTTLNTLDATSSVISDLSQFIKFKVWISYPLLLFLAIIAWLIPIASIITPGTLSVRTAAIIPAPTSFEHVPNVAFTSLNYVNAMGHIASQEDSLQNNAYQHDGPSRLVQRIANEAATDGTVLPIHVPWLNASWSLDFAGPGLECNEVPKAVQAIAERKIMAPENLQPAGEECTTYGYLAWSGSDLRLTSNATLSFGNSSGPRTINMAAMPQMMAVDADLGPSSANGGETIPYLYACNYKAQRIPYDVARGRIFIDSTMLQCGLRNYTYHVSFNYTNGQQDIKIDTAQIGDSPLQDIKSVSGYYADTHSDLINNSVNDGVDCTVLNGVNVNGATSSTDNVKPCSIDTSILQTLSYQAIFDAFETLVVGTVSRIELDAAPTLRTGVNNTILVDTPELSYLKGSSNPATQAFDPLQQYIMRSDNKIFQGLVNNEAQVTFGPLKKAMENLFQDITVSMMSEAVLRPNPASSYAPSQVQVTHHSYHNVYVYAPGKLWIAYGLSIGFTTIGVAVGLFAVFASGASYKGSFSTIFRVARGAEISLPMQKDDLDGKDPLSEALGKAKVRLHPSTVLPLHTKLSTTSLPQHTRPSTSTAPQTTNPPVSPVP